MKNEDEELKPEEQPEQERLDFNSPDFTFMPRGSHGWQQRGYYLVCKSCELEHAVFIGADKLMVGIEGDGRPILKTRLELGMV